jgi:hypothetical protein
MKSSVSFQLERSIVGMFGSLSKSYGASCIFVWTGVDVTIGGRGRIGFLGDDKFCLPFVLLVMLFLLLVFGGIAVKELPCLRI